MTSQKSLCPKQIYSALCLYLLTVGLADSHTVLQQMDKRKGGTGVQFGQGKWTFLFFFNFFETGSHCVDLADLEFPM